jgi:hypothetical protein
MKNTVRIAIYDEIFDKNITLNVSNLCKETNLVSLVEVTREQLDYGV